MARSDYADHSIRRMELRRFAVRCDTQEGLIQRADTLREVFRLTAITMPSALADDIDARDTKRRVMRKAEERAQEIILEQIERYGKAEAEFRENFKNRMLDDWTNLTGPLSHLRPWAKSKLHAFEQSQL
jgi:hypothetical protein